MIDTLPHEHSTQKARLFSLYLTQSDKRFHIVMLVNCPNDGHNYCRSSDFSKTIGLGIPAASYHSITYQKAGKSDAANAQQHGPTSNPSAIMKIDDSLNPGLSFHTVQKYPHGT